MLAICAASLFTGSSEAAWILESFNEAELRSAGAPVCEKAVTECAGCQSHLFDEHSSEHPGGSWWPEELHGL